MRTFGVNQSVLLQVKRGSAVFAVGGQPAPIALARLREMGQVLMEPETIGNKDYLLNPIEELSSIARSLQCEIVLILQS